MLKNTLLIFFILFIEDAVGQDVSPLPRNPNTQLISISKVIALNEGSNIKNKEKVDRFFQAYSEVSAESSLQKTSRVIEGKIVPIFLASKMLEEDSALSYDCLLQAYGAKQSRAFGSVGPITAFISFKISIYIKLDKIKYECTNFVYSTAENLAQGGKFENDKPFTGGVKKWNIIRTDAVNQARLIVDFMETYLSKKNADQFNF